MNKRGETIVLKFNKDKCLAGFYAMGFDSKDVMGVLYEAIVVLCKKQGGRPSSSINAVYDGNRGDQRR